MKKIIVANWKCNPITLREAKFLFNSIRKGLRNFKNVEIVICPPFIYLPLLKPKTYTLYPKLGAQDCFWEEKGAFTGEISPKMLKDFRVEYVIIGHSERRALGETDEMINKKLKAAIKTGLNPILCIGETAEEREERKTFKVLNKQLKDELKSICNLQSAICNLIIAYEPVWAIGTGNPCQPKEAKEVLKFLRKKLNNIPILYGGSVNSKNAKDYIEVGFEGLLVGGASLNPKEFVKIIKSISNT